MNIGSWKVHGRRKSIPESNSDYVLEGQLFPINYVRMLGQLDSYGRCLGEIPKAVSDETETFNCIDCFAFNLTFSSLATL